MITLDKRSIEEILLEQGVLDLENFKKAREIQRENGRNIEDILLENDFVKKLDILKAKATKMQVGFVDLKQHVMPSPIVVKLIIGHMATRHTLIPIGDEDGMLNVAMKDPTDIFVIDDLRLASTREIKPFFADPVEIENMLPIYYPDEFKSVTPPQASFRGDDTIKIMLDNDMAANMGSFDNMKSEVSPLSSLTKGRLGKLLVSSGVISEDQLMQSLNVQSKKGGMIGDILVTEGIITKKTLFGFLEMQLGVPHVDLNLFDIKDETVKMVSESIARRYTLVPIEKEGVNLKVAMSDPMNIFTIDDLRLATGCEIIPLLADEDEIKAILDRCFGKKEVKKVVQSDRKMQEIDDEIKKVNEEIADEIEDQNMLEETLDINDVQNAPIVKMVNIMFNKATASGASDIHIEPQEDNVLVRYRVDGQLLEVMKYDKKVLPALVARIKIISGLNIAEKRIPQDGRITMKIEGKSYDLRVSILPTHFGEKIVIRIADKEGFQVSKKQLGFFDDDLEKFNNILSNPHGIVLVTGPTGSGKSTTLYAALGELCRPNVNILTVEDPIESVVKGVNQVQVNVKAGLTFAAALRSFLRQDPDIIMLGEIRDGETAEIASRAAITGHLVLSTLHTNDAPSSVTRLIDMGIEPFLVSSSIVGIIAQRLVRRLCPKCKEEYEPSADQLEVLKTSKSEEITTYRPVGCLACNNVGYKGRIAVYEILTINRELKELIAKNVTSDILKDAAVRSGMRTLRDNCIRLTRAGITSFEEMMRVTFSKD